MGELRYIGSKISLVSKSDIRYVGILHSLDPTNATLSLEQVVSYGTEGRRGRIPVPPSDTVFSFIVFRGSDIKDLQVFEAPSQVKNNYPPPPPPPPPSQYIHAMTTQPMMIPGQYGCYYYPPPPPPPPSSSNILATAPPYSHNSKYPQQQQYPMPTPTVLNYPNYNNDQPPTTIVPQMPIPTMPLIHKPEMPPSPSTTTQVPHSSNNDDVQEITSTKHVRKPDLKDDETGETPSTSVYRRESSDEIASSIEQLAKSVSELGIGKEQRLLSKDKQPVRSNRQKQNKKRSVPCHDFDFASSNAKFDKQELRHLLEEEDTQMVVPQFYDKNKSFFDDISCDAKEQADHKGTNYHKKHWHEKQLNMETFGESSAFGERGRGRGRGRGMHRGRANGRKQLRSIA
ncbi:hypothetical protein K492DRAFT_203219 [Lichtheimia hyalospora FSU 10163]|nr:hypothetical protein K492DRAFT_203219 [Lichtheimia hyalospora FSU 10163]